MTDWPAKLLEWEAACEKATAGPLVHACDGEVHDDEGIVADTYHGGDPEFIALALTALPLAVDRIRELEAALKGARVDAHDQYCAVNRLRSPFGPCNCWCSEHNARIDAALGKP